MTKQVGRRGVLGLAKESVRGTAIGTPTFWIPRTTISFDDKTATARGLQALGNIADSNSNYVTQLMAEGDFEFELDDRALGIILTSLIGASPVQSGGPTYTYTYTLSQSNQHQSLTILYQDVDTTKVFPLGVVDGLKITVEPNGIAMGQVSFKSKYGRNWATQTANFTAQGSKFLHQHLVFKLATNTAGLAAASAISLKKLEVNIKSNTDFDSVLGTVEPEDILNHQFSVDGQITLTKTDETYRNLMLNGTYDAMQISFVNGATSQLNFQFPRVDFTQWQQDRKLDEIVAQTINFKANYDAANAVDIISTCTLINNLNTANY